MKVSTFLSHSETVRYTLSKVNDKERRDDMRRRLFIQDYYARNMRLPAPNLLTKLADRVQKWWKGKGEEEATKLEE
jgi:hypothetical protein